MKEFKTDSPEFFVFKLDGKEMKIPTFESLTIKELEAIDKANAEDRAGEWQIAFLRKHLGKEIVDNMSASLMAEIITAWYQDGNAGESSALSES